MLFKKSNLYYLQVLNIYKTKKPPSYQLDGISETYQPRMADIISA
nr:MAG TPA: hypothetical protein [Caudoviricetes sp.]